MTLKKFGFIVFLIISLLIINNFLHSIYSLWQKTSLITREQQELEREKKESQILKSKLNAANSTQFVEEEARDKLFLTKPGEGIVIIPSDYLRPTGTPPENAKDLRPNWQKWWDLFF